MGETNNTKMWDAYEQMAQVYLDRPIFKGTPMTGKQLRQAAETVYNAKGIYVPVELALAQAQKETAMGRVGRHPKTNPFNMYEQDSGTKKTYGNIQDSINDYFNTIATDYLGGTKTADNLAQNFVNKAGNRYASDKGYESYMQTQLPYTRNYMYSKIVGGK